MAKSLKPNDKVYVPCARLELTDRPFALYETEVVQVTDRSVVVSLPNGSNSAQIGASLVHKNLGIAIVRIGDFATELTLLDPLAKSMLQYCRLLVTDSAVALVETRSIAELTRWWSGNQAAYSHVLLVGHGRRNGVRFAVDEWVGAEALGGTLSCKATQSKVVLSLCCQTGHAPFGQVMSRTKMCGAFVGPFNAVHGAIGSQFCQTFLAHQLLEGQTTAVAFRNARKSTPGSASFRLWQQGKMKTG